jgi:hypothetical protein
MEPILNNTPIDPILHYLNLVHAPTLFIEYLF